MIAIRVASILQGFTIQLDHPHPLGMLAVDCQICKDPLGGPDKLPAAMPCGHMYCLDCATFWFNSGENKKCFCGKVFTGDQVIRLWTSDDGINGDNGNRFGADADGVREREELAAACRADIMNDDVDMNTQEGYLSVLNALQRVQSYVEAFTGSSNVNDVGIKNLLADVRYTLSSIKNALDEKTDPISSLAKESLQTTHQTLRRVITLLDQERSAHQSTISNYDRQVDSLKQMRNRLEEELRERKIEIQECRGKVRELRDRNADLERKNVELKGRVEGLTHSALKAKKKYYALKQSMAQKSLSIKGRSTATQKPDDDSIIVLD